jgi:hypothetical protein
MPRKLLQTVSFPMRLNHKGLIRMKIRPTLQTVEGLSSEKFEEILQYLKEKDTEYYDGVILRAHEGDVFFLYYYVNYEGPGWLEIF